MMFDPADDRFLALLDRYLAGECTSVEADQVRAWLDAAPANRLVVEDAERFRYAAKNRPPARSAKAAWQRAVREFGFDATAPIGGQPAKSHNLNPRPHRKSPTGIYARPAPSRLRIWLALAATLVLAAGALVVRRQWQSDPRPAELAVLNTYTTARGERAEVRLADGSRVVLAPATTLRIMGDTSAGKRAFATSGARTVTLDGQAYFDVVHDAAYPFEVRTAHGVARDLGTAFVVSSYAEVKGVRVVVQEGIVALHRVASVTAAQSDSLPLATLHAGDLARLDTNGRVTLARGVDVDPHVAWIRDSLVFQGTPLRDVALAMSRWFDLDIVLADSAIGGRRLVLTIDTESPDHALALVAVALNLRVERLAGARMARLHALPSNSRSP